ncbi:hypothetical protein EVAR_17649_1 [Eumeta japonica]|uniref:Uncharacterized protein n=1 Tax=Eumeta variegata TaxID=151549 RepID=A0A4C1URK5_EUMVA|nr:hypothetical protein EVAR_17649_1 [Eumeta japonica]
MEYTFIRTGFEWLDAAYVFVRSGAARLDPYELRTVVPYTYTLSERSTELHGRRKGGAGATLAARTWKTFYIGRPWRCTRRAPLIANSPDERTLKAEHMLDEDAPLWPRYLTSFLYFAPINDSEKSTGGEYFSKRLLKNIKY